MLSLKSAKQEDVVQAIAALKEEIAGEFGRYAYILKSDAMAGHVREKYTAIMEGKAERSDYNTSLKFLSKCLRDYYGQKVIIMIDEYDVPLESAYTYHYYTTIPNEEVRYIFRNKVLGWFREEVRKRDQTKLFGAFLHLDTAMLRDEIEDMLWTTISFNDYYESFYHGFLAGILYGMDGDVVKLNHEGGTGRTDLFIRPVSRRKTAYVVGFKVAQKYEDLDKKAEEALEQIEDKAYERELRDDGYVSIVRYGIAFLGKNCEVKVRSERNE